MLHFVPSVREVAKYLTVANARRTSKLKHSFSVTNSPR
uniref:Uncharacterized protein n=1 Tax=Anguilla anguilla TaxID=7936 RepID=A0A0E9TLD6_ANGAN